MTISTERLILREYTVEDFSLMKSVYTDPEIMKYAYWDVYSDTKMRRYFEKVIEDNNRTENRSAYEFAVFEKKSGQYIGSGDIDVDLKNNYGGYAEIGYFLLKSHWGKGYAAEIAKKLIEYCFDKLNLHKVYASCHALNKSSEKVMRKSGMKKEAVLKKVRFKNKQWHDEIRYAKMIDDWTILQFMNGNKND